MRLVACIGRPLLGALLLWATACAAGREPAGAPDAAAFDGSALSWQRQSAALDQDGSTAALYFELPTATRVFALRAYPTAASAAPLCFALRDVVVNGSDTWVGADTAADSGDYCIACAQRVSVGTGYGFAVLPSAADAELWIRAVSARISLRDCLTLTAHTLHAAAPSELWVELASWSLPEPSAWLSLPLTVAIATRYGLASDSALLPAALEVQRQIWAVAGISIALEPSVEIAPPEQPVVFSAADSKMLDELAQRSAVARGARKTSVPMVIFTPCLVRTDLLSGGQSEPWALTPHLPGGAAVNDVPDAIFIAAERCEGLAPAARFTDAAQLGAVLAHELGHYLGLYHVAEQDGRQDALTDTDVSEPNLMRATPSPTATVLSASQIAIARRHHAFATSP